RTKGSASSMGTMRSFNLPMAFSLLVAMSFLHQFQQFIPHFHCILKVIYCGFRGWNDFGGFSYQSFKHVVRKLHRGLKLFTFLNRLVTPDTFTLVHEGKGTS